MPLDLASKPAILKLITMLVAGADGVFGPIEWPGGFGSIQLSGTFGAGTVQLSGSLDDETYTDLSGSAYTQDTVEEFRAGNCFIKATITGSTNPVLKVWLSPSLARST